MQGDYFLKIKCRKYVEVHYDPALRNWEAAIEEELKRRGLQHGQVTVICKPLNGSMKKSNNGENRGYQSGAISSGAVKQIR